MCDKKKCSVCELRVKLFAGGPTAIEKEARLLSVNDEVDDNAMQYRIGLVSGACALFSKGLINAESMEKQVVLVAHEVASAHHDINQRILLLAGAEPMEVA